MGSFPEAIEAIEVLVRSEVRIRILDALREHEQLERDSLKEQIDASRTTIRRSLEALEEHNWVIRENTTYSITPCGELVADELFQLIETTQVALTFQPIFRWISPDEVDFDLRMVENANVTLSDEYDPYAPVNRHVESLKETVQFRGLLPRVGRDAMETALRQLNELNDPNAYHEVIVQIEGAELLQSDPLYTQLRTQLEETGRYTPFVYDGTIPHYLGILDGSVQIGIIDDSGVLRALIESDSEESRIWAEEMYEEYKREATRLE